MKRSFEDSPNTTQDITNEDLHQFLQTYLKSLLLYKPCSANLLLPLNAQQEDKDQLQNLYSLLNQITSEQQINELSSLKQDSQKKRKTYLPEISQEQKILIKLDDEQINNKQVNLLDALDSLTIRYDVQNQIEQLQVKESNCWG